MMRKRWILVIVTAFLIAGLLHLESTFQPVKAQEQTTSFSDDFSSDSGAWQYLGSAYREQTNQYIVLTTDIRQWGAAFFNAPIQGSFTANFRYKAGENYQGDGFTMFFFKQNYSIGYGGIGLGFSPISGVALWIWN
jgi:hypothetical protein